MEAAIERLGAAAVVRPDECRLATCQVEAPRTAVLEARAPLLLHGRLNIVSSFLSSPSAAIGSSVTTGKSLNFPEALFSTQE